MAIAVGDPNGDGHRDLVLACRQPHGDAEQSWIYWGNAEGGYHQSRRTPLGSFRACDVAVGDLDADGCDEVVLCQNHTEESFSWVSYLYRGSPNGPLGKPVELPGEDARRVFFVRASTDQRPQIVLVNHMARNKLGISTLSFTRVGLTATPRSGESKSPPGEPWSPFRAISMIPVPSTSCWPMLRKTR